MKPSYVDGSDMPAANASRGEEVYVGTETYSRTCSIGKHKVEFYAWPLEVSERGACGGSPGHLGSVVLDGEPIMASAKFNNICYASLDYVRFRLVEQDKLSFELCGFPRAYEGQEASVGDCVIYGIDDLPDMVRLSRSPLSKAVRADIPLKLPPAAN